jgi:hypothetical protein
MTFDYDDLPKAASAHSALCREGVRLTFFPNRELTSAGGTPKTVHRIVVAQEDAERAEAALREAGLSPPL